MIESLTPEQELDCAEWRKKWLAVGWGTWPTNGNEQVERMQKAETAMTKLYAKLGYKEPEYRWYDSPHAALDAIEKETGNRPGLSGADGHLDAALIAFYGFMPRIGVKYPEEDQEHLDLWQAFIEAAGPAWPHENVCLMTRLPKVAKMDAQERPHCEDGPAIAYLDGHSSWAIHGVLVTEQIVMAPETLTIDQINGEENAEVRRVMVDRYGPAKYLEESGADKVEIDTYHGNPRVLLRDKHGNMWLMGSDNSTGRFYTMPVPADVKTCREAHEAICGFPETKLKHQS